MKSWLGEKLPVLATIFTIGFVNVLTFANFPSLWLVNNLLFSIFFCIYQNCGQVFYMFLSLCLSHFLCFYNPWNLPIAKGCNVWVLANGKQITDFHIVIWYLKFELLFLIIAMTRAGREPCVVLAVRKAVPAETRLRGVTREASAMW